MIHLPKDGTKVRVWPAAGRKVPASMPRTGAFAADMPKSGATVIWDDFRYRQYLAGDLHFFDPETGKGEPYEFAHPHHEHNLELAATWPGECGELAKEKLAKLRVASAEKESPPKSSALAPSEPTAPAAPAPTPAPAADGGSDR